MSGSVDRRYEAQRVVQKILRGHGFVQERTLQLVASFSQDARREIEEALLAKDRRIGSSVLTLAKNLYTSEAQFVFELLQNADDNAYTRGQVPHIVFRVYPDRIIIDCNEDGFTEQNLNAICDIGKSSKTGSQGYIGEKGIGFKSVFMVSSRVHIQSGHFSIQFNHRKGDSGMGMITPIWQDARDPDLPFEVTRITLYLHEQSDPTASDRDRETINKQFHELQDTLLLFLRKLRKIEVSFYDEEGHQTKRTTFTLGRISDSDTVSIERTCTDAAQNRKRVYQTVKHIARNIARSENRDFSTAEEASRSFATSEIVLAFPVTEDLVPIIEPQDIFAFLPVRRIGFNFLIQADFVTQANRQDIVITSRRNRDLIKGIADAFIEGMLQLSEHETLKYKWMRYLPYENYPWDGLWKDLVSDIKSKIGSLPLLLSLEQGTRRSIKQLYQRPETFNDHLGAPLFADLRPEVYLCDSYAPEDIKILKKLGLDNLTLNKVIYMVEIDLQAGSIQPQRSRIRSPDTQDDWHIRACRLLNLAWENKDLEIVMILKRLDLIPLQNGQWVCSDIGDIYYPKCGSVDIPKDLSLRLVDQVPMRNPSRRALFDNLGVKVPTVSKIRQRILHPSVREESVSLESSIERMKFLFLTHHLRKDESDLASNFKVYNQLGDAVYAGYPNKTDFYISNDDPYGAERFLRQNGRYDVNCVNSKYFEEIPSISASDFPLSQWMLEHLGIRQHLRLVSRDQQSLSTECLDTARTRPAEFLGFLKHLWSFEGHIVLQNPPLLAALKRIEVLCMNGQRQKLCEAYLPLKSLLDVHKRFMGTEYFPFIQSSEFIGTDEISPEWSFLVNDLGVRKQDNLEFRLRLMSLLIHAYPDASALNNPVRVIELYQSIDACLRLSQDRTTKTNKIRDFFKSEKRIFVPSSDSFLASWKYPTDCLWNAPSGFITKIPLKPTYASSFQGSGVELEDITGFFCRTLNIQDVSWKDVISELEELKHQPTISDEVVRQLYGELYQNSTILDFQEQEIRESFETKALIYFDHSGTPSWHRPSDCVWSDTTHIHGKIAINAQYSNFREFFIEKLRVPSLDLKMVLNQLQESKSLRLPVSEVKELLKTLNSFLRTEQDPPSPKKLLLTSVFPVREPNGDVNLHNASAQFAVVDREGPPSRFRDMIKVLDFTLQEIRLLEPLLSWAGLESRYISRCVKEISRLGDDVAVPISQPGRDLKRKAYALLRIAAAFNSPRYEADPLGFYDILRSAVTLESGMIASSLLFEQDDVTHEIEVGQSELHIEDNNPLIFYVPNNIESQECCFKSDFPRRFTSWMMTDPKSGTHGKIEVAAINVVNSILNCLLSTTGRILEKEGIPQIPNITEAEEPRTPPMSPENKRHSSPMSSFLTPTTHPERSSYYSTPLTDPGDYDFEDGPGTSYGYGSRRPSFLTSAQQSLSEYRRLLEGVVALARRTSIPQCAEDVSAAFQGLSVEDDPFDGLCPVYHSDGWERNKQVGAAGELFVFEILSNLNPVLARFGRDNWCSTIRRYAQAHPEYTNLLDWTGRETSDIVYDDTSGALTRLMISLGYLNLNQWAGKTPYYYIEVKCTTAECDAAFYVSQSQADRMEQTTNGPQGDQNQHAIYAVFRVFNLGRSSMRLKIYMDPAEQRRVGKLSFTTDKYSVIQSRV